MAWFPIRIKLAFGTVSIIRMFTWIAPVFPTGIASSARFVSCRQIAGIPHRFAARLDTVPTECHFTGKTCFTHFALSARGRRVFFAERTRRLFALFAPALVMHHPPATFALGNARITIAGQGNRRFSLHKVGLHAYRTRIGIKKRHFVPILSGDHRCSTG